MRTFDCERLDTTYFARKNRRRCRTLHAKIEKVAKRCMQKSTKLQNVAISSWKQLKTLNYIYFEYLGSCTKKLQKFALIIMQERNEHAGRPIIKTWRFYFYEREVARNDNLHSTL